jgi:hypothetical protein
LSTFDRAAKGDTVEMKHAIEVDHAQDEMIKFADTDHGWRR